MIKFEMCDPCRAASAPSLCDGDCKNNIWYVNGKCKLDQLTYDQVYYVLQHNRSAKKDLLRVTTDPALLQLAERSRLTTDEIEDNRTPYKLVNNPARTLPFYTLYNGNLNRNFKP